MRRDREGAFMRCDHCMKRIVIQEAGPEGNTRWVVSKKQECDRVIS